MKKENGMNYIFPVSPVPSLPIVGHSERFPVHRIYCVGRNYEEHAKEMGATGREPPFFFLKPADALVAVESDEPVDLPYPSLTKNLHHEVELVLALAKGGENIAAADAQQHIYGYAVGLDMTRRDLQGEMKKQGRPWSIGKGFDASAPVGPITPVAQAGNVANAEMRLSVNGAERQRTSISKLIWNIGEIIQHLSHAWRLQPGDLIFTGTPAGVGPVVAGDKMEATIDGLSPLRLVVR
jgi:fumarylpyruvate hydrolase